LTEAVAEAPDQVEEEPSKKRWTSGDIDGVMAAYIMLRLLLVVGLLLPTAIPMFGSAEPMFKASNWHFGLAAAMFGFMGFSAALLPRFGNSVSFRWSQLFLDTIFATALILSTQGPVSPFFPLYFLNIVAAAWILSSAAAVLMAALDATFYGAVLWLVGPDALGEVLGTTVPIYVWVAFQVLAFFLVGILSGLLSSKLRTTTLALAQQQEAQAELEARYEQVMGDLPTGVLIVDPEGVIRNQNPFAMSTLGDLLERSLEEVLLVEDEPWEQLISRDGERVSVRCSRGQLEGGGQVVLVEDVTLLREMEVVIAREERLAAVGRLAAGLAHEIRNPLASLSGSVQLLRDETKDPLYDIVLREVQRLNDLVEDFLDTARPVRLSLSQTDPGAIIGEVTATFRNDERYKGRRVVRTQAKRLPAIVVDPGRFRQVIWNLLLNGAQATPDYGTVSIRAEVEGDGLVVEVEDDGMGIHPDRLERIFDPFYTTRSGGTGLGLANVDRIVRAHGGDIQVFSSPGKGTRFRLRFPLSGPDFAEELEEE
jgi:two-component system sensor histidine kinase PilS (NtrC family)